MLSGRRLDLLDPTPMDIEIEDIAHGLSFVARWNGQTHGDFPYSVAEHSLLVLQIFKLLRPKASIRDQMYALLHDSPEYVIGDMISPVKQAVGSGYEDLDQRLSITIHIRFGLPSKMPAELKRHIKQADTYSARLEATAIAGFELSGHRRQSEDRWRISAARTGRLCPSMGGACGLRQPPLLPSPPVHGLPHKPAHDANLGMGAPRKSAHFPGSKWVPHAGHPASAIHQARA